MDFAVFTVLDADLEVALAAGADLVDLADLLTLVAEVRADLALDLAVFKALVDLAGVLPVTLVREFVASREVFADALFVLSGRRWISRRKMSAQKTRTPAITAEVVVAIAEM